MMTHIQAARLNRHDQYAYPKLMIGLPRDFRHLPASRRGLLKGFGAEAAQMSVAAVTAIELQYSRIRRRGLYHGLYKRVFVSVLFSDC